MRMKKIILLLFLFLFSSTLFATTKTVRTTPLPGTVTLTFDDGPSPIFTPEILAILKKNNIKATFFVVGASAKKYPELIKAILAEGHKIGSHTWTHPMLTKISDNQLHAEVINTQNIIDKITGKKPLCLRPPYGLADSRVKQFILSQHIIPVPMGFNSFDYERRGTDTLIHWVLKNVHSGQVILMHDGYAKREQTVAALQPIIDGIRKKGLGFSSIC